MKPIQIKTDFQLPKDPKPIYVIGAGGIMEEAHLPAYQKARWQVKGIFDPQQDKAEALSRQFQIPKVFSSLQQMVNEAGDQVVYDIAVPASKILGILEVIPPNSAVMIQKPLGENLQQAKAILDCCNKKNIKASVNFQMKFIPSIIAAKNMIDQGLIGDLHDMEIRMNIYHPWELWDFLFGIPRMEMLYHSIHYMEMIKYFLGMPDQLYAKTFQHPKQMQLASTRSIIIFDYHKPIRAFVNTNHGHDYNLDHQDSFVKWEGTKGAIKAILGKNINFPKGEADHFLYFLKDDPQAGWVEVDVPGAWYPDAFMATMADLQCAIEDQQHPHHTSISKAYDTMRLVEAAYISNDLGGTNIPE